MADSLDVRIVVRPSPSPKLTQKAESAAGTRGSAMMPAAKPITGAREGPEGGGREPLELRDYRYTAVCTVIDPPTLLMHASYQEDLLRQG